MTFDTIGKLASAFLERYSDPLLRGANRSARRAASAVKERLERTYAPYLHNFVQQTSETKSFVVRDRPVPLSNIFVPVDLTGAGETYTSVGLSELAEAYRPTLIMGSAGTGKSLLMRHLALDAVASCSYIPVLLELRRLSYSDIALNRMLFETVQNLGLDLTTEEFSRVLTSGRVALFLDGLDEIPQQKRLAVTLQILELTSAVYSHSPVLVTSRHEQGLSAWPHFRNLYINPLSLERAAELVTRLPIAREIKFSFLEELERGVYESRRSFASNPLLLTIMVLTFTVNAHIPAKRSLFLDKAYDVLFEQHDALKLAFRRERPSGLDIEDFAKLFSAFSLLSYDDERTRFPESYARRLVITSCDITGLRTDPESFIQDAVQAASLLLRDGLELAYAHRSFQEYFAARFIVHEADSTLRTRLLESYYSRALTDEVLDLAFEINPRMVERDYLIEKSDPVRALFSERAVDDIDFVADFLINIGLRIYISEAISRRKNPSKQYSFRYTVERVELLQLCDFLARLYYPQSYAPKDDVDVLLEIIRETWHETGGDAPALWRFDGEYPTILLARIAEQGGRYSLARLKVIKGAVTQLEENLARAASARDLLEGRQRTQET